METKEKKNTYNTENLLRVLAEPNHDRKALWCAFINAKNVNKVAEIGVYKGVFAEAILRHCHAVDVYYMIDLWKNLPNWKKPSNKPDHAFESIFQEAIDKNSPWKERLQILRGRTEEVIDTIPDESVDFIYVDGDHTLQGITIDLINAYRKIPIGGFLAGDDFTPSIWQHHDKFEPTFVFPFAVHFARAVGAIIYGLPGNQFLIEKQD